MSQVGEASAFHPARAQVRLAFLLTVKFSAGFVGMSIPPEARSAATAVRSCVFAGRSCFHRCPTGRERALD